jgi:nitrile hydratase
VRYQPDDAVRVANRHPAGHTRQPRYARGRVGRVVRPVGAEPLPEDAAQGICRIEHVYLVRFEAAELWGEEAGPNPVYLELWESYLEPVG